MNHYEQKVEARRERLLARADRLRAESTRRFNAAMSHIAGIEPGQPILVGHHSEKRHRRDLERHDRDMRAGIEAQKAAAEAAYRAEHVGTAGISSDDPEAPGKLRERIQELEAKQARMVLVNRLLRKGDTEALLGLGLTEKLIEALKTPHWSGGPIGYAGYEISNNGANIRRLKLRLAQVERLAERETTETMVGNSGIRIVENAEANRLQIFFPGKPESSIRQKLKRAGFRWAPSEGAWQRHLSSGAKWHAEQIVKEPA